MLANERSTPIPTAPATDRPREPAAAVGVLDAMSMDVLVLLGALESLDDTVMVADGAENVDDEVVVGPPEELVEAEGVLSILMLK